MLRVTWSSVRGWSCGLGVLRCRANAWTATPSCLRTWPRNEDIVSEMGCGTFNSDLRGHRAWHRCLYEPGADDASRSMSIASAHPQTVPETVPGPVVGKSARTWESLAASAQGLRRPRRLAWGIRSSRRRARGAVSSSNPTIIAIVLRTRKNSGSEGRSREAAGLTGVFRTT